MGKSFSKIGKIVGIVALSVVTVGIGTLVAGGATLGAALGGSVVVGGVAVSFSTLTYIGILGLSIGTQPTPPSLERTGATTRGTAVADPTAIGVFVFGTTTVPSHIVFEENHGTDLALISNVMAHAWHEINSYVSLEVDGTLVTFSGDAAQGSYLGVLTWTRRLGAPGQSAIVVSGTSWPSTTPKFEGVAHSHMRWNFKNQDVLRGGVPNKLDIVVEGAMLYDPRNDSSVGGVGSEDLTDPTTWTWDNGNAALVLLRYLIGEYDQNNGDLIWGRGAGYADIDMSSFQAMANIADETVDGKPRFRLGGMHFLDGDFASFVKRWEQETGGKLAKPGGVYTVWLPNDDLTPVTTITEGQFLTDARIDMTVADDLTRFFNTARGRYIEPADGYRGTPYPEVGEASAVTSDGGKRILYQDFSWVQDESIAERIARIHVRRSRYQRIWTVPLGWEGQGPNFAPFTVHNLNCKETDDTNQLVRVIERISAFNGATILVLQEEAAAIYDDTLPLGDTVSSNTVSGRLDRIGTVTPRLIDGTSVDDAQIQGEVFVGPQLNPDPDFATFDLATTYWFSDRAATLPLTDEADWSLAVVSDGLVGGNVLRHNAATGDIGYSAWVPIDPNETYYVSIWARSAASREVQLGITFFQADGTVIHSGISDATGWASIDNTHWAAGYQTLTTSWLKLSDTFGPVGAATVPTGAAYCSLAINVNPNFEAAANIDLQQFQLLRNDPVSVAQGGVGVVTSLPSLPDVQYPNGSLVFLTTDGKLYRNVSGAWSVAVDAGDINSGTLSLARQNIASHGWTWDATVSAVDSDTVQWSASTIETSDGSTYAIGANNTGNITARTYIYLDIAVSITQLQTTTVRSNAVGAGKILVAVAENSPDSQDAFFHVFGGKGGVLVTANEIAANAITANEIRASAVTTAKLDANAVTADKILAGEITAAKLASALTWTNTMTLSTDGKIKVGKTTVSDTTAGFWLGYDGTSGYDFHIGDATLSLWWDASAGTLKIVGDLQWGGVQSFTPSSWTGFSTPPTGTMEYLDLGTWAILWAPAQRSGTSGGGSSSQLVMNGLPSAITPSATANIGGLPVIDASVGQYGKGNVNPSGTVSFSPYDIVSSDVRFTTWAGSGTKGLQSGCIMVYPL